MNPRACWLIAKSVLLEVVRRREIYAIILVSTLLIGVVLSIDFFGLEGVAKFQREIALKVMAIATAITVITLSARQLPREFERRTIYPLLAKPINRMTFLAGKLLGVMLAASFCFGLFMLIYIVGTLATHHAVPWGLFLQYVYLQLVMMLVLACLGFWLSMLFNLDAAVTVGTVLYFTASTLTTMVAYLYDYTGAAGQAVLKSLIYLVPQLTLFDLSGKTVHAGVWSPLSLTVMLWLTLYGLLYAGIYFACAGLCFRRRAL